MQDNRRELWFISILIIMVSVMPFSLDVFLPILPSLKIYYNASIKQVQLFMTLFLMGFGIGQLFVGYVSDRFGRKLTFQIGAASFLLVSWLCFLSSDITYLCVLRFFQGACVSVFTITSFCLARERFSAQKARFVITILTVAMSFVPAFSPIIGSWFQKGAWDYIFILIIGLSAITLCTSDNFFKLLTSDEGDVATELGIKLTKLNLYFVVIISTLIFISLFNYLTLSPFIYITYFSYSPAQYSYLMAINAIVLACGSALFVFMNKYKTVNKSIVWGSSFLLAGAVISFITLITIEKHEGLVVYVDLAVATFGVGILSPATMALILQNVNAKNLGKITAATGFIRFSAAMIYIYIASLFWHTKQLSNVIATFLVAGMICLLLASYNNKVRNLEYIGVKNEEC